jgi:hypothetical protein
MLGARQDDGIAALVAARRSGDQDHDRALPHAEPSRHQLARHRSGRSRGENKDARFGETDKDAQLRVALELLQKKIAARN